MDQSLGHRILVKIGLSILAIAIVDLVFLNYWVIQDQQSAQKGQNLKINESQEAVPSIIPSPLPSSIATPAAQPQPSPTTKTETIVQKETQTIVQTAQKEIFIPIGTGSTYSNSYADIPGLEVVIDSSKYSAIDYVVFEASIWVQDGNGKINAQLYVPDVGAVLPSEISTSKGQSTFLISSRFNFLSGSRTYKVQAKTALTSYAAHVDNARIHIVLK